MTDKEKKNKIADILLEFYEEYQGNIPNRPMIPSIYAGKILDLLQEELISEELEKAANEWDAKASFTPFYMALDDKGNPNGVKQDYTTHAESFKAGAKWQKQKDSMLVSEDLEKASYRFACKCHPLKTEYSTSSPNREVIEAFKAGAKWQKEKEKEIEL